MVMVLVLTTINLYEVSPWNRSRRMYQHRIVLLLWGMITNHLNNEGELINRCIAMGRGRRKDGEGGEGRGRGEEEYLSPGKALATPHDTANIKGIFSISNILWWHESEDINKKAYFQNFSWFQFDDTSCAWLCALALILHWPCWLLCNLSVVNETLHK